MRDLRPTMAMKGKRDSGTQTWVSLMSHGGSRRVEGFAMAGAKNMAKFHSSTYSNLWSF